ncbi:MAG TPA: hypothetical protein PLD59_05800 [Tepidisphaeraceae bacterium]|nr:hypothetical protein [Tepidisphaeraceae bacterium]
MKKSVISIVFAIVAAGGILGYSIAGEPKKDPPKDPPSTQKADAPINKFCGVMQEHEIDPEVTYVYKEKTVAFCCADCIDEFKKDPEKYMKTIK